MRAALFHILLFFLAFAVRGQSEVRFQVNLEPLVQEKLLSPDEECRVYVRGSFNNWQGTSHELKRQAKGLLYCGSFYLNGQVGDTIPYKYVLERRARRFFWEENPDPSNPDHGNRRLILTDSQLLLPEATFHPGKFFTYPVIFPKEELQADFLQFRSILEETHPALYDYTEKAVLDSLFNRNYAAIEDDLDFESFLMLMTEVISQVGCGHSSLWIPGDFWAVAPSGLFPLKLRAVADKLYITGAFSDCISVPAGSELISINGEALTQIVSRLASLTSSDGFIQAFRRAKVAQNFALKYALAYGFQENFRVQYLPPDQKVSQFAELSAVDKEQVDLGKEEHNELSMKVIDRETALLTINTFAYYGQVNMFKSFVDSVFHVIHKEGIENLILDLRGNGGGDPFCSSYLWGYLQDEALPYFDDHYGRYDTLANPIPLPALHFQGRLFTLIDGFGFSTTGHFCGLLKYHRVGEFVGSETGATYTCTGNATYPPLDHTGIMVGTARVMRYTAAVKDMDPRHGVLPDYSIEPTQTELISGKDAVLDYALSLASGH
jgi:hypothetical protein